MGRISEVVPTDETKEAVRQALEGVRLFRRCVVFYPEISCSQRVIFSGLIRTLRSCSSMVCMNSIHILRRFSSKFLQNI